MNWNIKNLFKRKQENKQESKRNYFWKKKPRIDSDVRKFEKELN